LGEAEKKGLIDGATQVARDNNKREKKLRLIKQEKGRKYGLIRHWKEKRRAHIRCSTNRIR
jgi:hypothetical protein